MALQERRTGQARRVRSTYGPEPAKPRIFAEGLAIPLGILPWGDGVYAQHGPDIRYYRDKDGDGKADGFDTILSGFGIDDSHLFAHQFTPGPGGWIYLAQGAFNHGEVRRPDGSDFATGGLFSANPQKGVPFSFCKLARMRPMAPTSNWSPADPTTFGDLPWIAPGDVHAGGQ
ncbi:DUF7133 domain-containing protein [Verrucomicrobium spinosum]|uniref:DUF7133 domain-containing protein n=1 Tax=Verrucomicrobium spinosum TaxID=2736 RepID=UPI003CCCDC8C